MNLFAPLPDASAGEAVETLLRRPRLRIERILSLGQASPPGFWYDQPEGEWVVLLSGAAGLRFADEAEARTLIPGDWLDIAPHRRHRVEWTDATRPTLWLAVFYCASGAEARSPRTKPDRGRDSGGVHIVPLPSFSPTK